MKSLKVNLACALLTLGAPSTAASYQPQPTGTVTVIRTVLKLRDEPPGFQTAAIEPTAPGQIGINPAPLESMDQLESIQKWLTEEGGTTKWIGVDLKYITIATTTRTDQAGSTAVTTITKGVNAVLAADGGLDVLLSPGVRAKLEELAKQVKPCSAKRLRARAKRPKAGKRQAACGFKQYQQLIANDDELGGTFTDQLADQINQQVNGLPNDFSDPHNQANGGEDTDSGYGGSEDGSEHGDEPQSPNDNNDEGFYEGYPECGKDCVPTTRNRPAEATKSPTGLWWEWACSQGNAKDCVCNPVGDEQTHYYWADMQGLSDKIIDKLKAMPQKPARGCDGELSTASSEWFGKISDKFCQDDDRWISREVQHTVYVIEGLGNKSYHYDTEMFAETLQKRSVSMPAATPGSLNKRAPPESEDSYKDYKFYMYWYPSANFEKATCLLPKETLCKDAYQTLMRSNCGSNTGSPPNRLFVNAKLDVGCGKFGWRVEKISR
ncbi:hypothetical protein V8F06_010646 [Rhypophila decipiens]